MPRPDWMLTLEEETKINVEVVNNYNGYMAKCMSGFIGYTGISMARRAWEEERRKKPNPLLAAQARKITTYLANMGIEVAIG